MKLPLLISLLILFSGLTFAQIPEFSWVVPYVDGKKIAVDSKGNAVIAGYFYFESEFGPFGNYTLDAEDGADIFIQKLDSTGSVIWLKKISSIESERVQGIFVDQQDNIYLTGDFWGTVDFDPGPGVFEMTPAFGDGDSFYMKLNSNGEFLWAKTFGARVFDGGNIIYVDEFENVFIAGDFQDEINDMDPGPGVYTLPCNGYTDIYVEKIDVEGNLVWANSFGGGYIDHLNDMVVDHSGNVYLTGSFNYTGATNTGLIFPNNDKTDIFLFKYLPNGDLDWGYSLGSTKNDSSGELALDSAGNLLHTFYISDTVDVNHGVNSCYLNLGRYVQKRTPHDSLLWVKPVSYWVSDLYVDKQDSILVTGSFSGTVNFGTSANPEIRNSDSGANGYLAKFDSEFNLGAIETIESEALNSFWEMSVDQVGNIYLSGKYEETVDFDWSDENFELDNQDGLAFVLRLGNPVHHFPWNPSLEYLLSSKKKITIGPNPTSGILTITQNFPKEYSLEVYDNWGRLLQSMESESLQTTIDLSLYATGMYTIKVCHGETINTWKIFRAN